MIMPPCIKNGVKCDRREVGCHARCEEYLAFKKAYSEDSKKALRNKIPDEFRAVNVLKTRKRTNKPK